MEEKDKLKKYRLETKDKGVLRLVEALEIVFEWIDILYEKKILRSEQREEISLHLPKEIFAQMDMFYLKKISMEDYEELKRTLLREISELINFIILIGNLKKEDFDIMQFNMSQVFKKEEITTMMEWARKHISDIIEERKESWLEEISKREELREEFLKKISVMPQREINKLIMESMFEFSPGARTPKERIETMINNQKKIELQRTKFRKFEGKLLFATEDARKEAQMNIHTQIGNVRRNIDEVAGIFREKAREFASDEGPKKQLRKARKVILKQKGKLTEEIKNKGKDWEKNFGAKTQEAQTRILGRRKELHKEIKAKGKDWEKDFGAEIEKARGRINEQTFKLLAAERKKKRSMKSRALLELGRAKSKMLKGQEKFADDVQTAKRKFHGKAEEVLEKGKKEIFKAKKMVLKEKSDFEEDVEEARDMFSGKGREIDKARDDFIEKRDMARDKFVRRGAEVETEMYGTIHKEKRRFEKEKEEAKTSFEEGTDFTFLR